MQELFNTFDFTGENIVALQVDKTNQQCFDGVDTNKISDSGCLPGVMDQEEKTTFSVNVWVIVGPCVGAVVVVVSVVVISMVVVRRRKRLQSSMNFIHMQDGEEIIAMLNDDDYEE